MFIPKIKAQSDIVLTEAPDDRLKLDHSKAKDWLKALYLVLQKTKDRPHDFTESVHTLKTRHQAWLDGTAYDK